jgi:hypothetical protein
MYKEENTQSFKDHVLQYKPRKQIINNNCVVQVYVYLTLMMKKKSASICT